MPRGAGQRGKKRGAYKKRAAPGRMISRGIARRVFNPSPIFTESYVLPREQNLQVNNGFLLTTRIDLISQYAQYKLLYTKYKILSCKWMLMPYYSAGSADQNATAYNNSQGQPISADARVVYAINDSPNQAVPASEAVVLQDNGCRIRMVKNKLAIRAKPVPDLQLANGVYETQRTSPFLNFDTAASVPPPVHYGVSGFLSQPTSGSHIMAQQYVVYVKVTFQLKDPR